MWARAGRYDILNVDAIFQVGLCDITVYCIKNVNQTNLKYKELAFLDQLQQMFEELLILDWI